MGGNTIGIEVNTDGVLVVGFYQINGKYNKSDLMVGDYIKKVNNTPVNNLNELTNIIEKYANNKEVNIEYKRYNNIYNTTLKLIEDNGIYKTGLYVKDSIMGIGTLTYIDPESLIYGALGHEIVHNGSSKIVEIKDGNIFKNTIVSIDKSSDGYAGSKNAKYYYNTRYGNILKNTNHGIFGKYASNIDDYELVMVSDDIKIGDAYIYTVLDGNKVEEFKINIIGININSDTKNITFEIVDDRLIKETGGIVQGMSGSPIMQNGNIIGVVTHVIVDNPLTGYGLFITKMLEEGER
jgi:stage IV sporulation protein B